MLDLTNIVKPTWEVKISDKITVNVYPATKAIIDKLAVMDKNPTAKGILDELGEVYTQAAEILSFNKEGKKIKVSDVEHLDVATITFLFKAYGTFIAQLDKLPN